MLVACVYSENQTRKRHNDYFNMKSIFSATSLGCASFNMKMKMRILTKFYQGKSNHFWYFYEDLGGQVKVRKES